VGTLDSNGYPAKAIGSARYDVAVGNPNTPENEADVQLLVMMTDVRKKGDLSDYAGELEATTTARITDRDNGPGGDESATVVDVPFPATVPCSATADASVGATCAVSTSFNALMPGVAMEGNRAIWQLGQIQLFDGGADGVVSTAPNALFATQGLFAP
jgi:hypothetical protein